MKLKFKEMCHDKVSGAQYKAGSVITFDDERAKEILEVENGNFAEEVEEAKEEKKKGRK